MKVLEDNTPKTFCTLFDHNYVYKGLCLYHSLKDHCPSFTLWILALCDEAYQLLDHMSLANVRLIHLHDIEDEELREAKNNRTHIEYYWTLSPSLPLYVLQQDPAIDAITYIDADCFFFSDPEPIYLEMGDDSILIIEHRYSAERKAWEKTSGRFNVQLLVFKRDETGMRVLNKWRSQCNEWCYYREEEGRFGDQMYLDTWPQEFDNIHILQHKGGGLAPWNIKNYELRKQGDKVFVDKYQLIFYHFHAFKLFPSKNYEYATGYQFNRNEIALIYKPYIKALRQAILQVAYIDPLFHFGYSEKEGAVRKMCNQLMSRLGISTRK
jgi:hypothetical protein